MENSRDASIRARLDAIELELSARYYALDEMWVKEVEELKKRHLMFKEYECRVLEDERRELMEKLFLRA